MRNFPGFVLRNLAILMYANMLLQFVYNKYHSVLDWI